MPAKPLRYLMFGLLYFAQGSIMSYFTSLNALYLQGFQLSMAEIGWIGAIAMTPFILKIFFGMISDRFNLFKMGHRKPYIIMGLILQSIACFLVPLVNPASQYIMFIFFAFFMMSAMALYDTCTDGLALDITPKAEEGTIQGVMVAGRALGVVIVSGVIGVVAQNISWNAVFWLLGILPLLPLFIVLGIKEEPRKAEHAFEWKAFGAFKKKKIIMLGLLGALYSLIIYGANQNVNPFLVENFHFNLATAGLMSTVWGIGVVIGGIAGGKLTDKIGQRVAVRVAIYTSMIAIIGLALITTSTLAWILVFIFGLAFGYYETIYFALSMDLSDPKIAASMFSLLMAVANIGTAIGLPLSGSLAVGIGYRPTFILLALINLAALPMLPVIFKEKKVVGEG
ncbi:MAG: MFS transporter [Anaerolineaceae bacterium]|nr:MFS transporter [Anaerolineaceae bacterium]